MAISSNNAIVDCKKCPQLMDQLIQADKFRSTPFIQVKEVLIEVNQIKQAFHKMSQGTTSMEKIVAKCENDIVDLINQIYSLETP